MWESLQIRNIAENPKNSRRVNSTVLNIHRGVKGKISMNACMN